MKSLIILIIGLTMGTIYAQQKTYSTSNEQQLTWIGKAAVGGYAPEGTLTLSQGTITYSNTSIIDLNLEVDMRSLSHENNQLQTHLRDKDFFYVKKHPVATFQLLGETIITNGKVEVVGLLTIKSVSKEEKFAMDITISEESITLAFNETLNRIDYGITYNSPSIFKKMKEDLIADTFVLKGSLTFARE